MNEEKVKLTREEIDLLHEFRKDQEAKAAVQKREQDKETYKLMVDETVHEVASYLHDTSIMIASTKQCVFDDFAAIMALKAEIFGTKDTQKSHTFSSADGLYSITIGQRTIDAYDDTLSAGVDKIKQYIASLAKDDATAKLINMINNLLQIDKYGNLKPSRVVELKKMEKEIDNVLFSEGLDIIIKAYKPKKSCKFVSIERTDDNGKKHNLPLSMSAAEMD